jgi:hypothetical protein
MTLMPTRVGMADTIDSRAEILQHILDVRAYLDTFVTEMLGVDVSTTPASLTKPKSLPSMRRSLFCGRSPTVLRSMWRF